MTQSFSRARRAVDPRLEALAAQALENTRGRAAIQPPGNAGRAAASILAPLLKDTGVGLSDLQRHWDDIVGKDLGKLCHPIKLQKKGPEGDILTVQAHGAAAPRIYAQQISIIEKANLAGAKIKGTLQIVQGSPVRPTGNVRPISKLLTEEQTAAVSAAVSNVAPGRLRDALLRLGKAVAAR